MMIVDINIEEKQKAVVKAMLSQKILVTKQILDEIKSFDKIDNYYQKYIISLQETQTKSLLKEENTCFETPQIIMQYEEKQKKRNIQDFVQFFNARVKTISKILQSRQELQNLISIARISKMQQKELISVIGIVTNKQITKKENIIFTIEDISGSNIKIIVTKNKPNTYSTAQDTVLDEIIGVVGTIGDSVIFANNIIYPDIPISTEIKKSPIEEYAVVISDVHIGSALFLENEFSEFLQWIQAKKGNFEQRQIALKTKYVFIVGDLVDGVGIYPSQEKELAIKDIYVQYEQAAKLLSQIPKDKHIIICPGNHDVVRIAEPQPLLPKDICASLWKMPNVIMVTNPSIVRVGASPTFPGFDVLLYHGYSYDYYGDVVESIKNSGRHISDKTDLIMRFLLQRRHLAPTHTSTLYIPDPEKDPLIIEHVPDIFLSGHVHRAAVNNYRGTLIVVSSCFQAKTSFQEKVGHEPTPCHVPVINLQTRQVKILNFEKNDNNSFNESIVEVEQIPLTSIKTTPQTI